jgi:hypothetical protein
MNLYDKASLILTPNAYKASKMYALKPTDGSGDLTFSRASTAMRRNSAGIWESVASGVPRLSYPIGGACPYWLMEPQRTNLALWSADFSNAAWQVAGGASKASSLVISPLNTNATEIITDANAYSGLVQNVSGASAVYSQTFFVKKKDLDYCYIINVLGSASGAWFNISNGTLGTVSSGYSATITSEYNGFYRITLIRTDAAQTLSYLQIGFTNANNSITGAVGGTYIAYGSVESGSNGTSPIVTTDASVTRIADAAIKTSITSLIGQTGGTIYVDFIGPENRAASAKYLMQIFGSKGVGITTFSGVIDIIGGGSGASVSFISGNPYKVAICYSDSGNFRVFVNGVKTHDLNTYVAGTYSALGFGNRTAGDISGNTNIEIGILFLTPLSDAEAISLTTL